MSINLKDYESLLKRAREKLPEVVDTHSRFTVPEPDIFYEGRSTVLKNFGDIISVINREQSHLLAYLLRELGTAGNVDGKRAVFKRKLTPKQIDERIKAYVDIYVMCSECYSPDTKLMKDGRVLVLKCDACGAHRPVNVYRGKRAVEDIDGVAEGKTYEVTIQHISAKGDGVAKRGKFTIFVPNTKSGEVLNIIIVKTSGTIGFGKRVLNNNAT
ncbi:MAG: translation initiation factor IF-2 subunit beta [Thermoplasmata archaeon]